MTQIEDSFTTKQHVAYFLLTVLSAVLALPVALYVTAFAYIEATGCFIKCDPASADPLAGVSLGGLALVIALVPPVLAGFLWRRWTAFGLALILQTALVFAVLGSL